MENLMKMNIILMQPKEPLDLTQTVTFIKVDLVTFAS